ncbi:MAG: hypothetical protein MK193_00255 [Lentisphaeria bacterium]|nr:hypothetical protein [Lentisphaeria bacterium]
MKSFSSIYKISAILVLGLGMATGCKHKYSHEKKPEKAETAEEAIKNQDTSADDYDPNEQSSFEEIETKLSKRHVVNYFFENSEYCILRSYQEQALTVFKVEDEQEVFEHGIIPENVQFSDELADGQGRSMDFLFFDKRKLVTVKIYESRDVNVTYDGKVVGSFQVDQASVDKCRSFLKNQTFLYSVIYLDDELTPHFVEYFYNQIQEFHKKQAEAEKKRLEEEKIAAEKAKQQEEERQSMLESAKKLGVIEKEYEEDADKPFDSKPPLVQTTFEAGDNEIEYSEELKESEKQEELEKPSLNKSLIDEKLP